MARKREISPSPILSADQFLELVGEPLRGTIATIRAEKDGENRPKPSTSLVDRSTILTPTRRATLLDKVAELVDENLAGRSEMCAQFAKLIALALSHLGFDSTAVAGIAKYTDGAGRELFRWDHAWVRIGTEVVDGNTDILFENPMVPESVVAVPYWGPIREVPNRRLTAKGEPPSDPDVANVWWPELKAWLDGDFGQNSTMTTTEEHGKPAC